LLFEDIEQGYSSTEMLEDPEEMMMGKGSTVGQQQLTVSQQQLTVSQQQIDNDKSSDE
jgi:hypothetical protein